MGVTALAGTSVYYYCKDVELLFYIKNSNSVPLVPDVKTDLQKIQTRIEKNFSFSVTVNQFFLNIDVIHENSELLNFIIISRLFTNTNSKFLGRCYTLETNNFKIILSWIVGTKIIRNDLNFKNINVFGLDAR